METKNNKKKIIVSIEFKPWLNMLTYILFRGDIFQGQKYGKITGLGKKLLKGDKKGEKCIFIPQLVKSMHTFSPIDLKYTNLQKKV